MNTDIQNENLKSGKSGIIKKETLEKLYGEVISKTATNFYYVYDNEKIGDLADELILNEDINALAVTDSDKKVKGILIRRDFFNLLGKQFGRDVYTNKSVIDVAYEVEPIYFKDNIFSVVEKLSDRLARNKTRYFVLTDYDDYFKGLFSTKDLLIYLSDITQRDILLAKNIQQAIVNAEFYRNNSNIEIIGAARMAKGVGGDFYTIEKISEKHWFAALCDVSGKGVSASLLSVMIGGMINIYNFNQGIKNLLLKMNNYILNTFQTEKFVTGIFLKFNEQTGKITLYDMGHSFCYIYRNSKLHRIKTSEKNLPLGIKEDVDPEKLTFSLEKGDLFIAISDGIEEQINSSGKEYGITKMSSHIKTNQSDSLKNLKDMIFNDIKTFRKGQPQTDDMTLIIFQYN